jgi:hypothetical protein
VSQHSTLTSAKASVRYLGRQARRVKGGEVEKQIAGDEQAVSFEVFSRYFAFQRNSLMGLTLFMCGSADFLQACVD